MTNVCPREGGNHEQASAHQLRQQQQQQVGKTLGHDRVEWTQAYTEILQKPTDPVLEADREKRANLDVYND